MRITNRVPVRPTQPSRPTQNIRPGTRQYRADKTLLIGDSKLNPINTKGLVRGTHKHARSGATVSDMVNDIALYDLMAFQNIIMYVGGNDSSGKTDEVLFEETYDQIISLIKTSNPGLHLQNSAKRGYRCKQHQYLH